MFLLLCYILYEGSYMLKAKICCIQMEVFMYLIHLQLLATAYLRHN